MMSSLMRDWIRPTVCKQLDEALKDTSRDCKALISRSEDGTLTIHITEGKAVQVNEFISDSPPYQALVSDSYTQIRAVFIKSSTDKYQKKHKQSFSRGTNGAVLGITDYDLVFNPKSPPSQRIILRIEGFTLQGSEGSGNFGHPLPVEDSEFVAKLLSRLGGVSSNGGLDQISSLGPLPEVKSQARVSRHYSSSPGDSTPAGFSTQAPIKFSTGGAVGIHRDMAASNQALLALLNRAKGPQTSTQIPVVARISESPYAQNPYDNHIYRGSGSASPSSSASGQQSTMPSTSTLHLIDAQLRSKKAHGYLQEDVPLSQEASGSDASRSGRARKAVDGGMDDRLLSQELFPVGKIENGIRVRGEGDESRGLTCAISKPHQELNTITPPIQDADNPWGGLTRIPRKYVQIPKDQRVILEHHNSWYSQLPEDRQPDIRLPHKVLKEVQVFHDTLSYIVSKGEDNASDSDIENESPCESHSDSCNRHGENQENRFINNSRVMKKATSRSIGSKSLSPPRLVPLDRGKAMAKAASPNPISSEQGDSSVEGSLESAEMDSEHEMSVRNTERYYIQVDKMLPNGKILPDTRVDVPSASPTHKDGSSADEGTSWSLSPNVIEEDSSRNLSLQIESPGSVSEDKISELHSFRSQASLSKSSPTASCGAETSSTEEDDVFSDAESFSGLQEQPENQPKIAAERMIQALKPGLGSSSGIFSSSPAEMELSVPYSLGNQTQTLNDVVIVDVYKRGQPPPSNPEQPNPTFDIKRTGSGLSSSRSPQGNSDNAKSGRSSNLRRQRFNISSDPIIPGTFRSEASATFNSPRKPGSASCRTGLGENIFEANKIISATPGHLTCRQSHASPSAGGEKLFIQTQKHAESKTPLQKSHNVRGGKDKPFMGNAGNQPARRQQSWNMKGIEVPTSSVHEPSKVSKPGSVVSPSEPSPPSRHAPLGGETILSTLATPIKRRASGMRDMTESSSKRRRTLQAVVFDSGPEKDPTIDPTEMAKANRRKFLNELSLSSPIQSPRKLREDNAAQVSRACDAVAEMLVESKVERDFNRAWSNGASSTGPSHSDTDIPSLHLEKSSFEKSQGNWLDHSGHDTEIDNNEAPLEGSNSTGSIQNESTGLPQGNIPQDCECHSEKTLELVHDRDTITIDKVRLGEEYPSKSETIFDIFNNAYPSYGKSLRAFIRACVCLDWLNSIRKAPHPSLWDDFIRAFSTDYLTHIKECEVSEQKPMSAPEFYNTHVPGPVFMQRIMTLARFQEAFLLDPEETAKCLAKTHRKKHENSQESISTASSQITIMSKTLAERQDTPTGFHEAFSSAQQLNSAENTSRRLSDHVGHVELVSSHVLSVVSAPHSAAAGKRPFFETPSQLATQAHRNGIPGLSESVPANESQNNVVMEDPPEHIESPDVEIVRANVVRLIKQSPRRLPWSSSPPNELDSGEPIEVNGAIRVQSDARSHGWTSRHPPITTSLREREESPILGILTSNSYSTKSQMLQSEKSPALSTSLAFRQDHIFKTPRLPTSKSLGRRMVSMPGPVENRLDERQTSNFDEGPYSLRSANALKLIIPTVTATFKDFSKAFVPRQKRRSSTSDLLTSPSSDPSSSRMAAPNKLGSKLMAEPDTQAWNF